jgi:serine/threonine protein kinase
MSELLGKTLGQYQLIEEIDESGNTLVYKGFQPAFNRYVAVKILKPSVSRSLEAVQRFRQQGELLAQIHHPRLLEIYETGETEGLVFRAERLAENGSLNDYLTMGSQSPFYETSRLLALFQGVVEGLEFIHRQGFIHGNLRPASILLDPTMQPMLTEFGSPGRSGVGDSPYFAPEQVQGGVVDRRADVYALGVLLYATLVGSAPPAGVVVSPRSRRPEIPELVERTIFKAMAQNPDQRFQSAAEFLNSMRAAFIAPPQAPQPAYAPPPPMPVAPIPAVSQTVTVGDQKKGGSWIAIVLGVIVVLILCVGAIIVYQVYMENKSATPISPTQPAGQPTQIPPIIILPTQPPAVTNVLPTNEPRPTRPPLELPTNPPEQPTQPPQQPPQVEQPIYPPAQASPGGGLLPCGSVGLIVVPLVVFGAGNLIKKHKLPIKPGRRNYDPRKEEKS